MKKISISRLPELFQVLSDSQTLYLPARQNNQVNFTEWAPGVEYCAEALNTVKSAKDCFFPQTENLVSFRTEGKSISITPAQNPEEPFVLFGARACDVHALKILDMVFLSDPVDSFYKARREAGTVVTAACGEPEETCFCGAFGIEAAGPAGDVTVWLADDALYWEALTEKGKALTKTAGSLLEESDSAAVEAFQERTRKILAQLPLADLRPDAVNTDLLDVFQSPLWGELSQACIGCGTCTFVCPTCQCYDIRDFDTGNGIQRYRCWDSCMYSDFTLMAHGNPRTSQVERFRQRFMHKLVYFPENNGGAYSCVGCGRCLAKCPVSMNIAKVIKALGVNEHVQN